MESLKYSRIKTTQSNSQIIEKHSDNTSSPSFHNNDVKSGIITKTGEHAFNDLE